MQTTGLHKVRSPAQRASRMNCSNAAAAMVAAATIDSGEAVQTPRAAMSTAIEPTSKRENVAGRKY